MTPRSVSAVQKYSFQDYPWIRGGVAQLVSGIGIAKFFAIRKILALRA